MKIFIQVLEMKSPVNNQKLLTNTLSENNLTRKNHTGSKAMFSKFESMQVNGARNKINIHEARAHSVLLSICNLATTAATRKRLAPIQCHGSLLSTHGSSEL